ncbi:MAG: DUF1003 domain-containing protein [Nanoarchaeota archaeon]
MVKEAKIQAKPEHPVLRAPKTFGQKSADLLTKIVGSWGFIIMLVIMMIIWILLNGYYLIKQTGNSFDPFPFILLNLALSCLAVIQAPIILMSQNRQEQKDRLRSEYDYAVNRKAEKEIQEIRKQLDRIEGKVRR